MTEQRSARPLPSRGHVAEGASHELHWNWGIFLSPTPSGEATYLDWLLDGLQWTVTLSLAAWVIALVLGFLIGVLRTAPNRWLRGIAAVYVELFRNVPLLVQLFIWYFVLPELLPEPLGEAIKQIDPLTQQFLAAMVCLGCFTGARVCEQVRAGIESLPRGPEERRTGARLHPAPDLPPRDATDGAAYHPATADLGVPQRLQELRRRVDHRPDRTVTPGQQLVDYTAQPYEAFIAVTLLYMLINVTVMLGMRWLERRTRVPGYIGGK